MDIRDKFVDFMLNCNFSNTHKEDWFFVKIILSDEDLDYFMKFIDKRNCNLLETIIKYQSLSENYMNKYLKILESYAKVYGDDNYLIDLLCRKQKMSYEFIKTNFTSFRNCKKCLLDNKNLDPNIIEEIFNQYGDLL